MTRSAPPATLTRNQALVLNALTVADGPLSAYAILERLRDQGLRAPLQVYRALGKLLDLGVVHRLESLNAFVACRCPDCDSHQVAAFAICENCGGVAEFADSRIADSLYRRVRADGFRPSRTVIELRGRCAACHAERGG